MSQTAETPGVGAGDTPHWGGDISGGISAALVSLPKSLAYGAIAFAPLGPSYLGLGLIAGIYSSVVVGFFSSVFGGTRVMVSGSRASTALIFAAMLTQIMAFDLPEAVAANRAAFALGIVFLTIFLSGLFQMLFAALKMGALVNYVPYPVIAGFIDASALLIIFSQFWALFGISNSPGSWQDFTRLLTPGASFIVLFTVIVLFISAKKIKLVPPAVVGLIAGSALYYALQFGAVSFGMGGVIGEIPISYPTVQDLSAPLLAMNQETFWLLFPLILSGALSMALLGSFDSLLTAATADAEQMTQSDGNRELFAQGLGNAAAAWLGCLPGSGTVSRSMGSYKNGGTTPWAGVINVVLLAVFTLFFAPVIAELPNAVMVGLLVGIGLKSFDGWTLNLIKGFWRGPFSRRRFMLPDCAIIAVVVVVALATNLIVAVGVGIAMAVFLFLLGVSKHVIRRSYGGDLVHSHVQRDPHAMGLLDRFGGKIRVIELDGALFFGSCGQLEKEVEQLVEEGAECILLDFKRVGDLDSTGAAALKRIQARLKQQGIKLLLSYVPRERRDPGIREIFTGKDRRHHAYVRWTWLKLRDMGAIGEIGEENIFPDTEMALSHCENLLLQAVEETELAEEVPHDPPTLLQGLSASDIRKLGRYCTRMKHDKGSAVFSQGDKGDAVYFLVRGEVSVVIDLEDAEYKKRLHTILPGTIFGEMAVLDGLDRSATVLALEDSVTYRMDLAAVKRLKEEEPGLSLKLYSNLCRVFSDRLRNANMMINELER